jgi:hypothetical protein
MPPLKCTTCNMEFSSSHLWRCHRPHKCKPIGGIKCTKCDHISVSKSESWTHTSSHYREPEGVNHEANGYSWVTLGQSGGLERG